MKKYSPLIYSIILFLFIRCAHQISPTGGEEDKIPPEVMEIYPENGTTNFHDNYFEITFSEYVQKGSVREAVFISPNIEGALDYSWSGKTLEISFEGTLRENTTYTVTIGTDVQDYNNRNKMAQSYSFVFSTGDSIDTGIISGKVFNDKPSGIMIYAYLQKDTLVNPIAQKPDYISQVGENGIYQLNGLAKGIYNVFAVRDDFRDFLYNVGDDEYGAPSELVTLTNTSIIKKNINFLITKEDTIPPNIISVTMTDKAHIMLEFSEFVDSSKISNNNIFVFDSTSNRKIDYAYLYKGKAKPKHLFLSLTDTLGSDKENYLISEGIFDLRGNSSGESASLLTVNPAPDTVAPNLAVVQTEYENKFVDFNNPWINFIFDDGFERVVEKDFVTIKKEEEIIPTELVYLDNSSFKLTPRQVLKNNSEYKIEIDLGKIIDSKGNRTDSVFTVKIMTKNKLDFTGVSGKINESGSMRKIVELKSVEDKSRQYICETETNGNYNFERIIPGKYVLWTYMDADSNKQYTYGSVYPFNYSEKFSFYPDTLNVKARWPIGDVEIDFN